MAGVSRDAYSHGAMKSYHTSLSPYRRAMIAAAVVLATGSAAALAQSSSQGSANESSTGSSYQSNQDNTSSTNNSSNTAGTTGSDMSGSASANNATANDKNATANENTATTNDNSKLSWSDRHFITKAAEDNQHEIQAAQIAADKASSPDVRNFAQHMVQEHSQVAQELQSLASSKDVKLKDVKEDRSDRKLSKATGPEFDRDFVKQMVSDHKKVIKEFQGRAESAKDPELKAFAQKTLPNLQHHLEMAQQLEQSIVPTGRTGKDSWKAPTDTNDANASASTNTSNSAATPNSSTSSSAQSTGANGTTTGSTSSSSSTR
jgi:putative membrane protein